MGDMVRQARKKQKVTQEELAALSGVGIRFIRELEKGKATCEIGKVLQVLMTLGMTVEVQGSKV